MRKYLLECYRGNNVSHSFAHDNYSSVVHEAMQAKDKGNYRVIVVKKWDERNGCYFLERIIK